jgi:DNA-binding LytR/AlgR family response regulator
MNECVSAKKTGEDTFESTAEDGFYEPVDTSLLPVTRVDAANLIRVWQQLAVIAEREAPRIAFKAKGRILFLELAEIVAVQAEGNYVFVATQANLYLLHESLSSMAETNCAATFRSQMLGMAPPRSNPAQIR